MFHSGKPQLSCVSRPAPAYWLPQRDSLRISRMSTSGTGIQNLSDIIKSLQNPPLPDNFTLLSHLGARKR
jgi:hypothetical protein